MHTQTGLYLCLHLPHFILQSTNRHAPASRHQPIVIMDGTGAQETVVAMNRNAAASGARLGMSRLEASRAHGVAFTRRSVTLEEVIRKELLQLSHRITPLVEDCGSPDECTLVLEIQASLTLFGNAQAIGKTILGSLSLLNLHAHMVISCNFHTAVCIARSLAGPATFLLVEQGAEAEHLATLSTSCLPCTDDQRTMLSRWGISSFRELAALSANSIVARMGLQGKILLEMARGSRQHHFTPIEIPCPLSDKVCFDTPVELVDSLMFSLSALIASMCDQAAARFVAIAAICIRYGLDGGSQHIRNIRPALPTNDAKLLLKLAHLDLIENPPSAGVSSISVRADGGLPNKLQSGLFAPQLPEMGRLDVTMARIASTIGAQHAGTPVLENSHAMDSFSITPLVIQQSIAASNTKPSARLTLRRLRPSAYITIQLKQGAPASFVMNHARYLVTAAYGPWKRSHDWWKDSACNCDDWDVAARMVETGDPFFSWLSHTWHDNAWQMEGVYD